MRRVNREVGRLGHRLQDRIQGRIGQFGWMLEYHIWDRLWGRAIVLRRPLQEDLCDEQAS